MATTKGARYTIPVATSKGAYVPMPKQTFDSLVGYFKTISKVPKKVRTYKKYIPPLTK